MRILVAGATGYVGSRLVPELVRRGHQVVAVSASAPDPERHGWGAQVEAVQVDVTDPAGVLEATRGVDAVVHLVHALHARDFAARDRLAACAVRDAVRANGVGRVVYLSGLVPDVPVGELSPHLASRLEVEDILLDSPASTLSLRAGVIIGAGSTSFEILRQTASLLLVQPVPSWMQAVRVQPIAIADVVRTLADAVDEDGTGAVDIGGPDVVTYPELLRLFAEVAHLQRVQVPALLAPVGAVVLTAGLVSAAPYRTTAALVQSLRHHLVCRPGQPDPAVVDLTDALPLREALAEALLADGRARVSGRSAADPAWVRPSWAERAVASTRLPGSTVLGAALHVAEHRTRGLLGVVLPRR